MKIVKEAGYFVVCSKFSPPLKSRSKEKCLEKFAKYCDKHLSTIERNIVRIAPNVKEKLVAERDKFHAERDKFHAETFELIRRIYELEDRLLPHENPWLEKTCDACKHCTPSQSQAGCEGGGAWVCVGPKFGCIYWEEKA